MRLIIALLLAGFMALFALPGASMAHGMADEMTLTSHAPCPECPELSDAATGPHDCAHMASCAGAVLMTQPMALPFVRNTMPRHAMPPSCILASAHRQIDLPPPRLRA